MNWLNIHSGDEENIFVYHFEANTNSLLLTDFPFAGKIASFGKPFLFVRMVLMVCIRFGSLVSPSTVRSDIYQLSVAEHGQPHVVQLGT